MRTADFTFELPDELIAQAPAPAREQSRLLVLERKTATWTNKMFRDLPGLLRAGDLLVVNNSRVIPARLRAFKPGSGGSIEVFLVEEVGLNEWWTLLKPGKRVRPGTMLKFRDRKGEPSNIQAHVREKSEDGLYLVQFEWVDNIRRMLSHLGEIPLPPYIQRDELGPTKADVERYQTVFARVDGSVAAPTAGLHFTEDILGELRAKGVRMGEVTLHVGLGTFAPVKVERPDDHVMHQERYEISEETAELIRSTKASGGRVVAVGTTSLRVMETVAGQHQRIVAGTGVTRLFVYPPCKFRVVDALLTNFHLPESTLLMLVSAFAAPGSTAGRELILNAYRAAIQERYRFFSYGDAMLIV